MKIKCPKCKAIQDIPEIYDQKTVKCLKCKAEILAVPYEPKAPKPAPRPQWGLIGLNIEAGILGVIGVLGALGYGYMVFSDEGTVFHEFGFFLSLILLGISLITEAIVRLIRVMKQ